MHKNDKTISLLTIIEIDEKKICENLEIKDKYLFFQYGYMVLIPILNENKDKIYFSKFSIESNDIN